MNTNESQTPELLGEIWSRLDAVCEKLWASDSPAAVGLQATIEEFRGEVHRVQQAMTAARKALSEQRELIAKELSDVHGHHIRDLESQLGRAQTQIKGLEQTLAQREDELETALKDLAAQKAENVKFHDEYLKASSRYDEMQAKKMEEFYQELQERSNQLEALWQGRQKALEAEYKQRADALHRRHEESLDEVKRHAEERERQFLQQEAQLKQMHERTAQDQAAWEARKLTENETLLKRDEELKRKAQELASEYAAKQSELKNFKEGMQREIAELVRQYQAKVKTQNGHPVS